MKRNTFIKAMLALPLVFSKLTLYGRGSRDGKITFTPDMLTRHNYGLFIINTKAGEITEKNVGYASTLAWKLCWQISSKDMPKYGKVNVFTDGWFCPMGENYQEVCDYLNNNPKETYRLMTKDEVLFILGTRQQGFL
jgi:hypothetical protein